MSPGEQLLRMRCLRKIVSETDTYWWAHQLLRDAKRTSDTGRKKFDPDDVGAQQVPA
jgi:trehalose-6-phosphate synthase